MITFHDILGEIQGGKVLDVATGTGGFVQTLKENLASYDEITGVDNSQRAAEEFPKAFPESNIHFRPMDAMHLDFPADRFDTVSISFSLHHLSEPRSVLHEMMRVLRPGGYLIVAEMICDDQKDTQMSHVLLHHWWGAVDRARGITHNETYSRHQVLEFTQELNLDHPVDYLISDVSEDPHDPETIEHMQSIIDQYMQHLEKLGSPQDLIQQGERLRQRLDRVGIHGADMLIVAGRKP